MTVTILPTAARPANRRSTAFARATPGDVESSVFALALGIEPDPGAIRRWYDSEPIRELGGRTARDMVTGGGGASVLAFLAEIARGQRD